MTEKVVALFCYPTPYPTSGENLGKNIGCAISTVQVGF
jgi:hypothetical protein